MAMTGRNRSQKSRNSGDDPKAPADASSEPDQIATMLSNLIQEVATTRERAARAETKRKYLEAEMVSVQRERDRLSDELAKSRSTAPDAT